MLPNVNRKTPEAGPGPRLPGKKGLDRQRVLQEARDLCAAGGLEALTIKELAQRLGIQPPSVYAHFDGLGGLRRALALWGHQALAGQLRDATRDRTGSDALQALGHAYLDFIRREPGLYSATVATPDVEDVELRAASEEWMQVLYGTLHGGLGLTPEEAVHAVRGIRSIVHGFGQLESRGAFRGAADRDTSFAQVLRTFVAAVSSQAACLRDGACPGQSTAASRPATPIASAATASPAIRPPPNNEVLLMSGGRSSRRGANRSSTEESTPPAPIHSEVGRLTKPPKDRA